MSSHDLTAFALFVFAKVALAGFALIAALSGLYVLSLGLFILAAMGSYHYHPDKPGGR